MPTTESSPFISAPLPDAVSTDVGADSPVTRAYGREDESREHWQRLIDYQLIEWGRDPGQLEDDDIPPPSKDTIQRAILLAGRLGTVGCPAPTRIVPDAHGGVVFEREEGNVFESIRISADGSTEYCVFKNCRLVVRESWGVADR